MSYPRSKPADLEAWDHNLTRLGGHFLQSFRWGAFKELHGFEVRRIATNGVEPTAMAQLLIRRKGPISAVYIPRGPAWDGSSDSLSDLFERVDHLCRRERSILALIESDVRLPRAFLGDPRNQTPGPAHAQPVRTVKIPLLDDDAIMAQMRSKTRSQVRQANRRGVSVVRASGTSDSLFDDFYQMLVDTSSRNEFGVHSRAYYRDFLDIMGQDSALLVAQIDGQSVSAIITGDFADEGIYFYGASSTEFRSSGASVALQFAAMQWARERGAKRYDLWGIPAEDPVTEASDPATPIASRGANMSGLYRFKTGFGGEIVSYPPTVQRNYSRIGAWAFDRFIGSRNAE